MAAATRSFRTRVHRIRVRRRASGPGGTLHLLCRRGADSVCIPDDVTKRVPPLKWIDRSDWCPGCQWLEPSWWPGAKPSNSAPVEPGVQAFGAGPDFVELGLHNPDKSFTVGMYDGSGNPVASIRTDLNTACSSIGVMVTGEDGTTAVRYDDGYSNQRWILRPMDHAGELMLATKPDFTYDDAFVGKDSPNRAVFTRDWIVDAFSGFASLVDVKAGTATKIRVASRCTPRRVRRRRHLGRRRFREGVHRQEQLVHRPERCGQALPRWGERRYRSLRHRRQVDRVERRHPARSRPRGLESDDGPAP